MRARSFFLCAALLAAALPRPAAALDPLRKVTQYVHDQWQVGDGLPQGSVQAVYQSRDGYLWVATIEGVARFDGARFEVFDKSNTEAFKHNDVQAICEDAAGHLWFGTWSGLVVLEDGRFRHVPLPKGFEESTVNALAAAKGGGIWIGTSKGLFLHKDGAFTPYLVAQGLSGESVTALVTEPSGVLWVGTSQGLDRLAEGTLAAAPGRLGQEPIQSLSRDRDGRIWAATTRLGVFAARPDEMRLLLPSGLLVGERVWAMLQDRDGSQWFATASQGVLRLREGQLERYAQAEGLSLDTALSLHEDREGALWIGTEGTGLDRLRDARLQSLGLHEGLPDEYTWTVLQDRAGHMWTSTNSGGLLELDGAAVRRYLLPAPAKSRITTLTEDAQGVLTAGTAGDGVFRLEQGKLVPHPQAAALPPYVNAVYADRDGALWVGGERGGVFVVQGKEVRAIGRREGLVDDEVRSISGDKDGNVWVGTDRGLSRIGADRFARITNYTTREGLPHDTVLDVHVDAGGVVWIGTYGGGLARLERGHFTVYDKKTGLFDDTAYRILEDAQGALWISSNRGLFRVARQELDAVAAGRAKSVTSTAFGLGDGMRSLECNGWWQPAGWAARDGRLWFPTVKGLVVVDPARLPRNTLPPPVVLERVLVDGAAMPLKDGLDLPPGRRTLEFDYTGLSLLEPARVTFRYRLEGFDPGWVEAGGRRAAYYTNLPPGRYRFMVTAANNDGLWNEQGVAFGFSHRARFTQTWPFYALVVLGVVLLGFAVHWVRVSGLHLTRQKLEGDLARHVAELEAERAKLAAANVELERLATQDGLTGLANRRYFNDLLEKEWARAARDKTQVALVLVDVDLFKKLNDTYGHPTGDECLRKVAAVLQNAIHRPGDVAARYGGEEFAVLLPGNTQAGAGLLAGRMRREVENLRVEHNESPFGHMTISCGVAALRPDATRPPVELVEKADQALYRAKEEGRNRVAEAPPERGPRPDEVAAP